MKIIISVLAVTAMLVMALSPLVSGESSVTDGKTEGTDRNGIELKEILDALNNSDTGSLDLGRFTLIPIYEESERDEATVDEPLTKTLYVKDGEVCTLTGQHTFGDGENEQNNGKIVVQKGGKVALLPVVKDGGLTITNSNLGYYEGVDDLLVVESGAIISVCGIEFIIYAYDDVPIPLISLTFDDIYRPSLANVTFVSTIVNGQYVVGFEGPDDYNTSLDILGEFQFLNGTVFSIRGHYANQQGTVSFSDCTIDIDVICPTVICSLKTGEGPKSDFSLKIGSNTQGNIVMSANINLDEFKFSKGTSLIADVEVEATDVHIGLSELDITIVNTKDSKGVTTHYTIESPGDIIVTAKQTYVFVNELTPLGFGITVHDLQLRLTATTVTAETFIETGKDIALVGATVACSLSLNLEKATFSVPIVIFDIEIADIDNIEINISSLDLSYDPSAKSYIGDAGSLSLKLTLPNWQYLFKYDPTLTITFTDIEFSYVNGDIDSSFDLVVDIMMLYDGRDRHLTISLSDAVAGYDGKLSAEIGTFNFKNEIPLTMVLTQVILKKIHEDYISEVTAYNLELESIEGSRISIKGNGFSLQCNTITKGIADIFTMSMDSDFRIVFDIPPIGNIIFVFSSKVISGSVKNVLEDPEPFTITGTDREWANVTIGINWDVCQFLINSGNAVFGKGLMPFHLDVGENATFTANGLSADHFAFSSPDNIHGTVVFDLADRINTTREIKLVDNYLALAYYCDYGAYRFTYDLESKIGTIEAHDGWTILDSPYWIKKTDTMVTFLFDGSKEMRINNITSCEFNFSYDIPGSEKFKVGYYDRIVLTQELPEIRGKVAFGWTDGDKVYPVGGEYRMPARSVVMKAVYADPASPIVSGDEVTFTSETSDAVAAKVSDVGDKDVIFEVNGASVRMSNETFKAMLESSDSQIVVFFAHQIKDVSDPLTKSTVGDGMLYDIGFFVDGNQVTEFYNTSFDVKVEFECPDDKPIKGVSIGHLVYEGHLTDVAVKDFYINEDGKCVVTFSINHTSHFVIEPKYEDTSSGNQSMVLLIVSIVMIIALVIVLAGVAITKRN